MGKTYVTFGQSHVHNVNGETIDKDCVAVINNVEKASDGRKRAFALFDRKFCFEYYEDEFDMDSMRFYPRGFIEVE